MFSRRTFMKTAASLGAVGLAKPIRVMGARYRRSSEHFGVHPFVENHPEAVFVMFTDVDIKTNSTAKKTTGLDFARSVFLPMDETGIPLTHLIPIKPNLTDSQTNDKTFSLEFGMGIVTDPYFGSPNLRQNMIDNEGDILRKVWVDQETHDYPHCD